MKPADATIVVDLGFGDAGKGTIVDFLVRDAQRRGRPIELVVRFNGGAQAGHNVVTDDGRAHTFSQLGAGTFAGARTHLAESVVVHPTALLVEARVLEGKGIVAPLERLTIAEEARLITPFHQAANLVREAARGEGRHGTCGVGFGEAVADAMAAGSDALCAADLVDPSRLARKLRRCQERVCDSLGALLESQHAAPHLDVLSDRGVLAARWLEAVKAVAPCVTEASVLREALRRGPVVLEGAQGVLLDERHGFHPHTTWSDCTDVGARALLAQHGGALVRTIGVTRTYLTRHGAGPFPSEDASLRASRPEPHNDDRGAQGVFRVGALDLVLLRYAIGACASIDGLAVTHVDRPLGPLVWAYTEAPDPSLFVHDAEGRAIGLRGGDLHRQERLGAALRSVSRITEGGDWLPALGERVGVPITLHSRGPTAAHKTWAHSEGQIAT